MKIIRHWLKIYDKEFFYFYKYIVAIILSIIAFIIGKQMGILLLFFCCSFFSFQITSMHRHYLLESFLVLSNCPKKKQLIYLLTVIFLRSVPFILCFVIYIQTYFKFLISYNILFSILLYIYSILFGILVDKISYFYYLGYGFLVLYPILLLIAEKLLKVNYFIYISPTLPFYYANSNQIISICILLIVCICLAALCFWADTIEKSICIIIAFIAIIYCLNLFENRDLRPIYEANIIHSFVTKLVI